MTTARWFLVAVHALVVLGFGAYATLIARLALADARDGDLSEGARYAVILAVVVAGCGVGLAAAVVLWHRTGRRRYLLAADLAVSGLGWTVLVPLLFAGPAQFVALLGAMLLAVLVAIVVPPPAERSHRPQDRPPTSDGTRLG